jgi:hypothetical protein
MGTDLSSTVTRTLRELGVGMDGTDRLSRHARSFARHRMGIGQRDAQLTEARHTAHNDAGARNRGNVAFRISTGGFVLVNWGSQQPLDVGRGVPVCSKASWS